MARILEPPLGRRDPGAAHRRADWRGARCRLHRACGAIRHRVAV